MRTRSIEVKKYWFDHKKNYQGHGKVIGWYSNGQKHWEAEYKEENLHGQKRWKIEYKNGKLIS